MTTQTKPLNIVWLLTDHQIFQHHWALGNMRSGLPTYERLCREGVSFRQAQTVCPLCTPARASMLNGLYPHRHGMVMNNADCGSRLEFEPDEHLFSHHVRKAGYRAGYFGKWHCGEERTALDYEFEGWTVPGYGHPYWSEEYAQYLDGKGLPQATVDVETHVINAKKEGKGVRLCDEPDWFQRMTCSGVMTTPVETHEAYFLSHMAARWMEQAARAGDPFVLRVDVWGPHQPYWVGAPFAGMVDPRQIPEYPNYSATLEDRPAFHRKLRDKVDGWRGRRSWEEWAPIVARAYEHATQVDAAFGTVLDTIDRLGIADNTLVLYTADHGDIIGAQGGCYDKGALMVEETMRIPMAMRWPGHIPAGIASDRFVTNMDLVPTVLDAAKVDAPPAMDGASLLPIARDPQRAPWREDLMCEHHGHGQPHFQRLLRWDRWKYVAHLDDIEELYDLAQDPFELCNLAYHRPNAEVNLVLQQLRERLLCQMSANADNSEPAQHLARQIS